MGSHEALLSGASIGLTIAAPVGPMAVIVIRRTLAGGFLTGIMTGAGASTVHLVYATIAVSGIDQITMRVRDHHDLLTVATALVLLVCALRMLRPRPAGAGPAVPMRRSLLGHYASAIALNSMNPMSFALMFGAIAAVAGVTSGRTTATAALAAGVFLGSIAWWVCLVGATATIGVRLSPRSIHSIDIVAAIVLLALAISTMSRLL